MCCYRLDVVCWEGIEPLCLFAYMSVCLYVLVASCTSVADAVSPAQLCALLFSCPGMICLGRSWPLAFSLCDIDFCSVGHCLSCFPESPLNNMFQVRGYTYLSCLGLESSELDSDLVFKTTLSGTKQVGYHTRVSTRLSIDLFTPEFMHVR